MAASLRRMVPGSLAVAVITAMLALAAAGYIVASIIALGSVVVGGILALIVWGIISEAGADPVRLRWSEDGDITEALARVRPAVTAETVTERWDRLAGIAS